MKEKPDFAFSPSQNHGYIMNRMEHPLAYKGGDFKQWQTTLRDQLRSLLGDLPEQRVSLDPQTLWSRSHELGRIEKIVFTAEPYCQLPAYVCTPATGKPPFPFMICLQGHSTGMHNSIAVQAENEAAPLAVSGDRDFGLWAMRNGVAALCIEQRGFGERQEKTQEKRSANRCHDAFVQALMLGRTLLGERVYDVDRGIDYLESRGDADMHRIGVMGNSGGGTTSIYAAAVLQRLAFTMPSCSFCTFAESKMALYHCACGYFPSILKYAEMPDILGLFAPHPVVVVAGRDDPIIPLSGVEKGFAQLRRIYRAAGAEQHCHLVVGQEGHRFYGAPAWPLMKREIDII